MMGISPPDREEVASIRKRIAEALSQVSGSDRQDLSEWIDYLIDSYDPFGVMGKRVILVQIPDDPDERMSALSYTTEDFDSEVIKLDPGKKFDYVFENLHIFVSDDNEDLMRLKAYLVRD
jgi:hypothetical protein